jgi:hypothetical protein
MKTKNQKGEGNYEAARRYNKDSAAFAKNNPKKAKDAAQAAKKALDTPERAELEQAEQDGKKHAHGEDPAVARP